MEPTAIGVRLASSAVIPLVKKLFAGGGPGAGLVDRPVRISALVSFRGEQRALAPEDLRRLAAKLVAQALRSVPHGERPVPAGEEQALALALADTLAALGAIGMDDVQAVRLGHEAFARELQRHAPRSTALLSEDAARFHGQLVETAALHILNFLTQRSVFVARTLVEQSRQLDRLITTVDVLVRRNPSPLAQDTAFEARYATYTVQRHSELTIYGLDLDRAREWPLDTAYLSLEALTGTEGASGPLRAERAFDRQRRVLLRGLAGSGKTTLVQWLAVAAARQDPENGMLPLLGRVPFVLPLRTIARHGELPTPDGFLPAVRCPLAGAQPVGWADRVLTAGRGLLLVDGLDEVPEREREGTRRWLRDLLHTFPDNLWLVTSRPSAVRENWLERDGFRELELSPMSRQDVAAFIHRWHQAADADPALADALLTEVRAKAELGRLATNPLMCGLLCALHRERRGFLPQRRKELYDAALAMLLERRDLERAMPADDGLRLGREAQTALLQKLAYWLIRNGRSEMDRADALRLIERALEHMPHLQAPAERVFRYLLVRSGLLRQPTADTVDFVHRTFQDYLGAAAAVEEGDFPLLIDHAEDEQWEDVIRMAVAHARPTERSRILRDMIKPESDLYSARRVLLAAACLEHATEVDRAVHTKITKLTSRMIPPGSREMARLLAEASGPLVLGLLPGPEGLSDDEAEQVVITATRIATDAAIPLLIRYREHPSLGVRRQLAWAWHRFDTELYAEEIIAHLPEDGLYFAASGLNHLKALTALGGRSRIQVRGLADEYGKYLVPIISDWLSPERLTHLWFGEELRGDTDLSGLAAFPHLREVCLPALPTGRARMSLPEGISLVVSTDGSPG